MPLIVTCAVCTCQLTRTGDVPELSRQLQADADTFYYCYALKHLVNKPGWCVSSV